MGLPSGAGDVKEKFDDVVANSVSIPVAFALIASIALAVAGPASAERLEGADHGGRLIVVEMTGAAERPGPGDPDGSGTAWFTLNPGQEQICFVLEGLRTSRQPPRPISMSPRLIDPGPVVVPASTRPTDGGASSGCADEAGN